MKKNLSLICSLVAAITMFSCAENAIEPRMDTPEAIATRVDNDIPVMVYVETNDINPLNALTYVKAGTDVPFIDILNLFAANINRSGNDPCIHFNKELAGYTADVNQYIRPLQAAGMKVNMSLLPNWQGFGPANLAGTWNDTNSQVRKFARLVAYVVDTYGFDGVTINDHYAAYTYYDNDSYSQLIHALRAEFDRVFPGDHKLITVYDWGNTHQIDSAAGALIDYADSGYYGLYYTHWGVSGMTNDRWMPQSLNFGSSNNMIQIRANAMRTVAEEFGGIMGFNMRASGGNTLNYLNAIAQGLAGDMAGRTPRVTWTGVTYQEGPEIPGGKNITFADVPSNF